MTSQKTIHGGFPLSGVLRQVAEGNLEFARELLADAERDVRNMIAGEPRSETFKAETDPVKMLVDNARQVQLCEDVLRMDDEVRGDVDWRVEGTVARTRVSPEA